MSAPTEKVSFEGSAVTHWLPGSTGWLLGH
jgi:hypothetical protein